MAFKINGIDFKSQTFQIIFIASLSQFSISMILNCMHVLLPAISSELTISVELLNWITIIFLMTLLAFSIPLSQNVGYVGVKLYMQIGSIGLIAGLLLNSISGNIELFFVSRIIQGLAIAILNVCVYMIIILGVPKNKVGYALGLVSSAGYVGMLISPTFSGMISYFLNWRYVFILLVFIFIFLFILMQLVKDEWKPEKKAIDLKGSIIFISFTCLLVYGLSTITEGGLTPFIVSIILFIVFIKVEHNKEHPLFNLKLFKNIPYLIGNYAAMVCHVISFTVNYLLSIYLQIVLGLNGYLTGLVMMITPIIMVIVSPYSGKLSDYKDARILSIYGMIFMGLAMALLGILEFYPFILIVVALVSRGIGHGMFSAPNNKFVLNEIPQENLSEASALLSSTKEFGRILSLAVFNIICLVIMKPVPIQKDIKGFALSMKTMMGVAVIFAVSSIILIWISKSYLKKELKS